MGRHPIMPTIMAGKIEMVFPAMYIMKRFIGICFSGPSATSQQRCEETSVSGNRSQGVVLRAHRGRPPRGPTVLPV
uniref:Uncharacterized protein n=1 Tax=Pavo cristatus TaxID=9049 RepID=A0A8C9EYF2_PAVCR